MRGSYRAALAVAMAACGLAPAWSQAPRSPPAATRSAPSGGEREALLQRAETALARGDATLASETFERAASMLHAADTEMGIVRTAMQQGRYAQALAFAAHTTGAHLESPPAAALYAWLLRIGGQSAVSDRVLHEALARAPDDAVLRATREAFASGVPLAGGVLLDVPHRMAPRASGLASDGENLPAGAVVVSSGVLVAGGTQAIVPLAIAVRIGGSRVWLRDGLGLTVGGTLVLTGQDTALAAAGLARVRLDGALPFEAEDVASPAPLPAGRPAFGVGYVTGSGAAAWPWLTQGFIGSMSSDGARRLGIALAAGPHGGPVLDGQGRLAGIALERPDGSEVFVPAASWQRDESDALGTGPAERVLAVASPAPGMRTVVPAAEAYERAMRLALQVVAISR